MPKARRVRSKSGPCARGAAHREAAPGPLRHGVNQIASTVDRKSLETVKSCPRICRECGDPTAYFRELARTSRIRVFAVYPRISTYIRGVSAVYPCILVRVSSAYLPYIRREPVRNIRVFAYGIGHGSHEALVYAYTVTSILFAIVHRCSNLMHAPDPRTQLSRPSPSIHPSDRRSPMSTWCRRRAPACRPRR